MIIDCLQKDPSKRPTATELLKHPFFKKAKDKKYLTQTLVAIGPSMETRVHKVCCTLLISYIILLSNLILNYSCKFLIIIY